MMSCFPRNQKFSDCGLSIVCSVSDAASVSMGGEVRVQIGKAAQPVNIEWYQNNETALLQLSNDRRRAYSVPPGVYEIIVTDALQREASCTVTVQLLHVPAIVGYEVIHASGDTARDGFIRVHSRGMASTQKFIWSSGVITSGPDLHDVQPGIYVASPMFETDPLFLHECPPATVHPSRNTDMMFLT